MTGPDTSRERDAPAQTVGELGEHAIIGRIRARVPASPEAVVTGIGDDAAVVVPARNEFEVLTTDVLVEGVHFDRRFVGPADIGYKALAVNLSDLAAMAAVPRLALLSLVLPPALLVGDLDLLVGGLLDAATQFNVALVGGNIARSPGPLVVDVTVTGSVRPRRVLLRSGARAGDQLYVSGSIGSAAAGLASLGTEGGESESMAECRSRFLRPEPRVRLGLLLGRNRAATACVDLSDGLADGVRQLTAASAVGAIIDAGQVPIDVAARTWFLGQGADPVRAAIQGGEDYELLFSVPSRRRRQLAAIARMAHVHVTAIGRVTADRAVRLHREGTEQELPAGFVHFP